MFKQTLSFLTIISYLVVVVNCDNHNVKKLSVLVLYESLCPDSVRFMHRQLGPNYDGLKDFIDISLVPFGKSHSKNNGSEFFCQHGPPECLGNRQQSCVLEQTRDQSTQVKFVVCQMTAGYFYNANADYCANSVGLSNDIDACMKTEFGTLLQLEAERKTKLYNPRFVPTIIYDGVFNQQLQDRSLRDFHGTICDLLTTRLHIPIYNGVCR